MAKVTMPLLGVQASGSIGKSIVFGNWRGVNYARQHVSPGNPQTAAQLAQRNLMRFVVGVWQRLPAPAQNGWIAAARGTGLTGYNLFSKRALLAIKGDANLAALQISPGQSGATNLASLSASASGASITVSVSLAPAIPGTTITQVWALATLDVAPSGTFSGVFDFASDATSPYAPVVTATSGAGTYRIWSFTECVDSSGKTLYGLPLTTTVSVS